MFAQKTPFARSLNQFAERKIQDAMSLLGQSLPCSVVAVSGSIVTVKFEISAPPLQLPQVTIPVIGSEYIRLPIQVGCKGLTIAADAYLGGVSGLGGGVADLSLQANLSSLAFVPIGNKNFSATDDPNSVVIYGPDGVIIRNLANTVSLTLSNTGIAIKGSLTTTGSIIAGLGGIDQVGLQTHLHSGVTTGAGSTAPPTAGT